jgi:FlaA1/EpsC-like NDP-sugar epimerase/lipopolysaccharide/colanic/teichoic acid biosynthesis glycosyltransferase
MLKRLLDILLSLFGIAIAIPFLPALVLLIKLNSKGPVFYLCDRIGKDGKLFKMYKFRTMYDSPVQVGPSICPQDDPRVTSIGRFLRRTKINELPQLLNILKGDMTFVGPRPEAPDLAALYPLHAKAIFTVKPGLVGPNQILGRNEDEWYPTGVDPQQYYIDEILPKKLPLDLEYVQQSSVVSDLKYVLLGGLETLFKALNWKLVLQNQSQIYLLLADLVLSVATFVFAHMLRFEELSQGEDAAIFRHMLLTVVLVRIPCFLYFGLYGTLIRYLSFPDIIGVFKGVAASSVLLVCFAVLMNLRSFSRTVLLIDSLSLILLMSSMRWALRIFGPSWAKNGDTRSRRVLIFGAGTTGYLAHQFLMAEKGTPFEVVGFLDDDPVKRHKTLHGRKVLGNRYSIEAVVKLYHVHEILLAMPSASPHEVTKIMQACQQAGVRCRVFPTLKDASRPNGFFLREVSLAGLFEAQDIQVDAARVRKALHEKRVLLTGACGALGVELCRQILSYSPQKLIITDRYEAYLIELLTRLLGVFPADQIVPVLCPPSSNEKMTSVFLEYQPHVVFHTATRKYLPLFDIQVENVIRVNCLSTFELAKQAANSGCEYFVMVSSVEAEKRGNSVSDSLRAAEISLHQFFASQRTKLVTVRLCDILENRGGVVAMIEDQIAHREPVTLPHPDAKRRFLSSYAAVRFILQSLALAEILPDKDSIFVCDNGAPVSLMEIATRLAMLNGLQLEADLPVKFLNGNPQDNDTVSQMFPNENEKPVATTHAHISLLHQKPLPRSSEVDAAIHYLFNLQEHDLENAVWEKHTHTLLGLENLS